MKRFMVGMALVLAGCGQEPQVPATAPEKVAEVQPVLTAQKAAGVRAYLLRSRMTCDMATMYAELVRRGTTRGVEPPELSLSPDFQQVADDLSDFPDALSALKAFRGHERACVEYGDPATHEKLIAAKAAVETELELIAAADADRKLE